jgi:hypothetical protein
MSIKFQGHWLSVISSTNKHINKQTLKLSRSLTFKLASHKHIIFQGKEFFPINKKKWRNTQCICSQNKLSFCQRWFRFFLWMQIMSLHQLRNNALIFNPIKSSKQHLLESKQGKKVENLNQGIFQLVRSDHLCITRSKIIF